MIISLYLYDKIYNFRLPSYVSGAFSFDIDDNDNRLINIKSTSGKWVLYSTSEVSVLYNNNLVDSTDLLPDSFYILRRDSKDYLIYVSKITFPSMLTFNFDKSVNLIIGNGNNTTINYNCPYLGNAVVQVHYINDELWLEVFNNARVYINKLANFSNKRAIKFGDELEIFGLRILFLNGIMLIKNIPNKLQIFSDKSHIQSFKFNPPAPLKDIEIKDVDLYSKDDYYFKSPRLRRVIEKKEIKLSPPPKDGDSQELPLILTIGPMLTMGATAGVTILNLILRIENGETTLNRSWPQLITSSAMLTSMIIWPMISKRYNKKMKEKKKQEIITKYTKYLQEKDKELQSELKLQRTILTENLISVEECLKIIEHRNINFWDKRIDQSDFLVVRLGMGNEILDVELKYDEEDFTIEESDLRKKADELADNYRYIRNVPIGYSFFDNRVTAIIGSATSESNQVVNFMHNIILQLITFYSYDDLKIVMFTTEKRNENWEYLRYLNHCFNNERSFRFYSTTQETAKNVAEYLNFEINNRLNNKIEHFKPHYFVIVDGYENVKRYDFVKTLTESDDDLGFSLVILENKLSHLPSKCNNFIALSGHSTILRNSYEKQQQTEFRDDIHYQLDMMSIAKALSNIPIEFEDGIKQLPNSISFLEMEKVGNVDQLNILNRWNTNDSTASLRAEVGVDEQGDLMYLDLHEKYHGPHGLIAGMTGSGKSEFIITYILSMAINYSPDDVAFILIDYKGGGLAGAFENRVTGMILPHLAGTITNLDKAEMDRTLVSIDSEIKRRQQKFNEARDMLGESTIDIYKYQRFYKDGKLEEAIPHLFIICDEFAELKSQQPEFMDNLISVARIGRSLGVHLILATQKPSGVVNDQIWSNTKFRVCLKVQDESDSKEMLKRPEAASLKQTGRFYLQVGFNEYFALGQSAWCGAKYYPSEKIVKQVDKSINFIDDCGNFIKSIQASSNIKIQPEGEQLAKVMEAIIQVANSVSKKAKRLWLENIPPIIISDELEKKYSVLAKPYEVEAIIGEYDAPELQQQGIVKYNFLEDGNTIIYGNDGSEREMLLNTLIYSSVKNHTVDEINYYIIDYGSESLRRYNHLPHVGGMVFVSEDEKYNNLFKLIREEIQERKKLFADYNGEYTTYLKSSGSKLPLIVVIMNNYDSIYENDQNLYDELPDFVRDSERYGVIFILSANAINSIPTKIAQNFHNLYLLKLKDSSDYISALGARTKLVPRDVFGRGLFKGESVHEFQTASIVENDDNLNEYLMQFADEVKSKNQGHAKIIPILPEIVRFENIEHEISDLHNVPVGIVKDNLEIIKMDYLASLGNIISANKIANLEKFTRSIIQVFKSINNVSLLVVDATKTLKLSKEECPNYYSDNFTAVMDILIDYLNKLIDSGTTLNVVFLVYGFNKFVTEVNDNKRMATFTELLKKYEKASLVVVDGASKIKQFSFETWFSSTFNLGDAVWIGRGIADQNLLKLSNVNKEMTKDYKNNMGFVTSEGVATLCKMIDFVTEEDQDAE